MNIDLLREYVVYDHVNGVLTWKKNKNAGKKGNECGFTCKTHGYKIMKINKTSYPYARVCFALYHGVEPEYNIDHIDGNPLNNKIENLRDIPQRMNVMNTRRRKDNISGVKGVEKRGNRYRARITVNGVLINLGWFGKIEEAQKVRIDAEIKYFGEYRRCHNAT